MITVIRPVLFVEFNDFCLLLIEKKEELADFPQNANPTYGQCHKKKDKKKSGLSEGSMASKITPKEKSIGL